MTNLRQFTKTLFSKAWTPISLLAGALVVALASAWLLHEFGPREEQPAPKLDLQFRRYMGDYPTELQPWAGRQGIIGTYWEISVSNQGEATDSILERDLRVGSTGMNGASFYTGLDQGTYNKDLSPMELPANIDPGHALRFFVKVGILLDPTIQAKVLEKFRLGRINSIEAVNRYLYRAGVDVFSLPVRNIAEGTFEFPKSNEAPLVIIEVKTVKNGTIHAYAPWYPTVADFR